MFHGVLRWNETGGGWNKSPGTWNQSAGNRNENRASWNAPGTGLCRPRGSFSEPRKGVPPGAFDREKSWEVPMLRLAAEQGRCSASLADRFIEACSTPIFA
jgi:hypothetical protein